MTFGPVLRRGFRQAALQCRPSLTAQQPLFRTTPPTFLRSFSSLKYAKSHEWLRVEADGTATIGISDFAQGQLGEIVYCDLPSEGATFDTKEAICVLESVKAVGQVYAPGKCEVVAANEQLSEQPDLVNTSPENDGWLLKVKISDEDPELMDAAAYAKHVEAEGTEH